MKLGIIGEEMIATAVKLAAEQEAEVQALYVIRVPLERSLDAPMIDELAAEYAGAAKIGKVNIDDNQESAFKYGIEAIPTILIFKGGQPVQRFQGIPAKARVQEALDQAKA